jgi:hypothetical protein
LVSKLVLKWPAAGDHEVERVHPSHSLEEDVHSLLFHQTAYKQHAARFGLPLTHLGSNPSDIDSHGSRILDRTE